MKKLATIAICSAYGLFFPGVLANTGRSETLCYVAQSEELFYVLHQIYLEKKAYTLDCHLDQDSITLLQQALNNPAQTLFNHSKKVLDRLNGVIIAKHHYQAQVYQNFDGLYRSYQIMHSMHDKFRLMYRKSDYEKRLTAIKKRMEEHRRLIKEIQWEILTIGILLDQWVQRAAIALSPHLLGVWLGYCSVALSPESFTELMDHCVQRYVHEVETTTDKIKNYRTYLYMTMQRPVIKMNKVCMIRHLDVLKPNT